MLDHPNSEPPLRHWVMFTSASTAILLIVVAAALLQVFGTGMTKPITGSGKSLHPTVIVVRPTVTMSPYPDTPLSPKSPGKSGDLGKVQNSGASKFLLVTTGGAERKIIYSPGSPSPAHPGAPSAAHHAAPHPPRSAQSPSPRPTPRPSSPAPTPLVCVTTICATASSTTSSIMSSGNLLKESLPPIIKKDSTRNRSVR